jgi:hypothetical protein
MPWLTRRGFERGHALRIDETTALEDLVFVELLHGASQR